MNHFVKRTVQAGLLIGGLWFVGAGIANAATTDPAVNAPVTAPITLCGTSIGIFSSPTAGCPTDTGTVADSSTGSTANAPVTAPITIGGNTVAVGQPANATAGNGGAGSGSSDTGTSVTSTDSGIGSTLVNAPVTAPVVVCGTTVAVTSDASSNCPAGISSAGTAWSGAGTGDNGGSVTTANAPITAPVLVCGNTVGVASASSSNCPAEPAGTAMSGAGTGDNGVTTANAPVTAPVTVGGNTVAVLQDGNGSTGNGGTGTGTTGAGSDNSGSTTGSGTSGTLANAPVNAAVLVCGTTVAVASDGSSNCPTPAGGASSGAGTGNNGGTTGNAGTTGNGGTDGSGTTANAPVNAPVTACGITVGVGSDSSSNCPAGTSGSTSPAGGTVNAPVNAPVLVCGIDVAVLGGGGSSCGETAATITTGVPANGGSGITLTGSTSSQYGTLGFLSDGEKSLASTGSNLAIAVAVALGLMVAGSTVTLAGRARR